MPIEIKEGTARVATSFSTKAPDPNTAFASNDSMVSLSIEFDLSDTNEETVLAQLLLVEESLNAACKARVMENLGLEATTTADGTVLPVIPAGAGKAKSSGGGGYQKKQYNGGGQQSAPKSDGPAPNPKGHPVIRDADGVEWFDQRPAKAAGEYAAGAADFRRTQGSGQLWLTNKDGSANDSVHEWVQANGF